MIQAGSHAYSFWNWLQIQQQISQQDEVTFNIIGYSDRDSAIVIDKKPKYIKIKFK